jgi:hypothetical protein
VGLGKLRPHESEVKTEQTPILTVLLEPGLVTVNQKPPPKTLTHTQNIFANAKFAMEFEFQIAKNTT